MKNTLDDKPDPLSIVCPHCQEPIGKPCKTRGGAVREQAHVRRVQASAPTRGQPIPHPDAWRGAFLKSTMRTGFALMLSQAMLEFLCAVSDRVTWDRHVFRFAVGGNYGSNYLPTAWALEQRGLIRHRGTRVLTAESFARTSEEEVQRYLDGECEVWELTPAGEKVVELLKLTGVFVEQTTATELKAKGKR